MNRSRLIFASFLAALVLGPVSLRMAQGINTTATTGFTLVAQCNGPPTGTPSLTDPDKASTIFDATNRTYNVFAAGTWNKIGADASQISSGVLAVARGGTNLSSYTLGDTIYASGGTTLTKIAGNTTTTRKFYRQTGDGASSAAPAWDVLVAGDIPTALTLTTAAQPNITSLGTLTSLTSGNHTFNDAANLIFNTTTGTQIGTGTTQKLSFYGVTPVVQITGSTDVLAGLVTLGLRAASSNPPLNLGSGALTAGNITGTLQTAAQANITSLGTLSALTMGGTLTMGANTLALATATVSGAPTWSSNQAITLSTAAQPNITSLGTLTSLTSGNHTFSDAANMIFGTTTGTQIGTGTTQKIGFYGATPVVQITGSTDVLAGLVTLGFRAASSNPPLNLGSGAITAGNITGTLQTAAQTNVTSLGTLSALTVSGALTLNAQVLQSASDVLHVSRTTNPQTLRLYNTTDSTTTPTNAEWFETQWSGNQLNLRATKSGTGTVRAINIDGSEVAFAVSGSGKWKVESSNGNFVAQTDAAYDIGGSASTLRPRYVFTGGLGLGGGTGAAGEARITTGNGAVRLLSGYVSLGSTANVGWSSGDPTSVAMDTHLSRKGISQLRLGATANAEDAALFLGNETVNSVLTVIGTNATHGEQFVTGTSSELLTLSTSGTTTDTSANLLPAGAIILAVGCRVTTTITTATNWSVGDAGTATRFSAANSTLTSGTTSIGLEQFGNASGAKQNAAAKVRITTTGTPGAGAIRITVHYVQFTAPTT
jgi:hypothetical protein